MEKKLLSRREVMNMCNAVFNFNEYGIKPKLKDIRCNQGWRFLSYYFEDSEDNEYKVEFCFSRPRGCLSVTINKVVDYKRLSAIKIYDYLLESNAGYLCLRSNYNSDPEHNNFPGIKFSKHLIYC